MEGNYILIYMQSTHAIIEAFRDHLFQEYCCCFVVLNVLFDWLPKKWWTNTNWAEMLGEAPVLLDAVLIPFRGSIISDGLVMPYRICFGKGAREDFKDAYMNAKRNSAIRFSI